MKLRHLFPLLALLGCGLAAAQGMGHGRDPRDPRGAGPERQDLRATLEAQRRQGGAEWGPRQLSPDERAQLREQLRQQSPQRPPRGNH